MKTSQAPILGWTPTPVQTSEGVETRWTPPNDMAWRRAVSRVAEALCESLWSEASEDVREGYRQDARVALRAMGIAPITASLAGDEFGVL